MKIADILIIAKVKVEKNKILLKVMVLFCEVTRLMPIEFMPVRLMVLLVMLLSITVNIAMSYPPSRSAALSGTHSPLPYHSKRLDTEPRILKAKCPMSKESIF
jgi:hypothetical protein